jgi:hypothetical protein
MANEATQLFLNYQNTSNPIIFKPFRDFENEPFPLYLTFGSQLLLTLLLTLALWFGLSLRAIIISYLRSPDTNSPVNYLIWIDQLNGILLGVVILVKILAINAPVPLSHIFGERFCEWIDLPGKKSLQFLSILWLYPRKIINFKMFLTTRSPLISKEYSESDLKNHYWSRLQIL